MSNRSTAVFMFLFVCQMAFAQEKIYVGNVAPSQVGAIYAKAARLGGNYGTVHMFDGQQILKLSVQTKEDSRRIITLLKSDFPRQSFEDSTGSLSRTVSSSKIKSIKFDNFAGTQSQLLSVSHLRIMPNSYAAFESSKAVVSFTRSWIAGSDLRTAKAERSIFEKKIAAYPDGELPQAYIHCSGLGICWCEGYDSCNNLISSCTETNSNWGCTAYDNNGGCISGACSV